MTLHKVIYDTDPGVDDAMALVFQALHPDIELLGITSVFGNATVETTTAQRAVSALAFRARRAGRSRRLENRCIVRHPRRSAGFMATTGSAILS